MKLHLIAALAATTAAAGLAPGKAHAAPGDLYVAYSTSNTIERITPSGAASMFANTGLNVPYGLAFEPQVGPAAVSEPASLALLAVGVASLGLTRRKQVRSGGLT